MKREISIDALRGIAIIGMVLSGTISQNPDLPGWLFHAQVGPPDFKFHPQIPGITWVDLVFPFFLFTMGLAFPFSMNRLLDKGNSKAFILKKIVFRTLKLTFFAILLGHLSPFYYADELNAWKWIMGLLAFAGFFLTFSKFPSFPDKEKYINLSGYLLLIGLIIIRVFVFKQEFSIHKNDIIILVLANMALFGAIIWLYTRQNWWIRIGILAIYLGIRFTQNLEESWNYEVWNFTPIKALGNLWPALHKQLISIGVDTQKTVFYHANFIKYLFIVIPGTIAGDLMHKLGNRDKKAVKDASGNTCVYLSALFFFVIIINLIGLYSRYIIFNLGMNGISILLIIYLLRKSKSIPHEIKQITYWSIYWIILGLVFESYEGGIKKDHATLSYLFLTSGLSGFLLLFFKCTIRRFKLEKATAFIHKIGVNPMVGYVAIAYFILPVFALIGILPWMDELHESWKWFGLLRGLALTSLMIILTIFTVEKKYYWKT